ncbi:hypothetical protein [Natronomonas sp.]|uniref:DUF7285 family protein n=1 Tax=Natronomonas sp. TaxID=2184060 RepID=UPI003988D52D
MAALVAVFAVGMGLSLYIGAVDATLPAHSSDRNLAPTAADRLIAETSTLGAVVPPLETAATASRPTAHELNATLDAGDEGWVVGPPAPRSAECEHRRVSVRVAPGRIRPGWLEVCVWRAA